VQFGNVRSVTTGNLPGDDKRNEIVYYKITKSGEWIPWYKVGGHQIIPGKTDIDAERDSKKRDVEMCAQHIVVFLLRFEAWKHFQVESVTGGSTLEELRASEDRSYE
jgi:hypothetical protein